MKYQARADNFGRVVSELLSKILQKNIVFNLDNIESMLPQIHSELAKALRRGYLAESTIFESLGE